MANTTAKDRIRLRAQLAPANAIEQPLDHTVSERQDRKKDERDALPELPQNFQPKAGQAHDNGNNNTAQYSFHPGKSEEQSHAVEVTGLKEDWLRYPTEISDEEQQKEEPYQEYVPLLEDRISPRVLEERVERATCFLDDGQSLKETAGGSESLAGKHVAGHAQCPRTNSNSWHLSSVAPSFGFAYGSVYTHRDCGIGDEGNLSLGSADCGCESTSGASKGEQSMTTQNGPCRAEHLSQEGIRCAKSFVQVELETASVPQGAVHLGGDAGCFEAADGARMISTDGEESGSNNDNIENNEEESAEGRSDDREDGEDAEEDALDFDLRAERWRRICMHCHQHVREVLVLPCNHYNLCFSCMSCPSFWRRHLQQGVNAPFCLECQGHIETIFYPRVYQMRQRVPRCMCGSRPRGG